jgi:hypothetical protein
LKRAVNIARSYPLDVGLLCENALQQKYWEAIKQGASQMLQKVKEGK